MTEKTSSDTIEILSSMWVPKGLEDLVISTVMQEYLLAKQMLDEQDRRVYGPGGVLSQPSCVHVKPKS